MIYITYFFPDSYLSGCVLFSPQQCTSSLQISLKLRYNHPDDSLYLDHGCIFPLKPKEGKRGTDTIYVLKFGKAVLDVMWWYPVDPNLTCHADKIVNVGQNHGANKISKFSYEVLLCWKRSGTWLCLYEVGVAVEQLNYLLVSWVVGKSSPGTPCWGNNQKTLLC